MGTTQGNIDQLAAPLDEETRDGCMHELGALYAAGAMSIEELDTRICAAMMAETEEELAELVGDLRESQKESATPPVAEREPARSAPRRAPAPRPDDRPLSPTVTLRTGVLTRRVVLVGAGTAVVVAASVLLGSVLPVVVYVSALVGSFVLGTSGRRPPEDAETTTESAEPTAVDPPPSQDLALLPRPSVPAQRMPAKVHPVIVPGATGPASSDQDADLDGTDPAPQTLIVPSVRELPTAERLALGACPATPENADRSGTPAQADDTATEDRLQDQGSPIRPLFGRVTDRDWLRQHVRRGQAAARVRSS